MAPVAVLVARPAISDVAGMKIFVLLLDRDDDMLVDFPDPGMIAQLPGKRPSIRPRPVDLGAVEPVEVG